MSFYLLPIEGAGTDADPRRPKYLPALGVAWAIVDFDASAIAWAGTTPAQEAALAANADVTLIPPLDNTVAVVATQNAIEALGWPAQWVTAGMTYRTTLRVLVGMAQFIQRTAGLGLKFTLAGRLDSTMGSLSANVRQVLIDAADSLSIDRTAIVGSTTVREALRILGQQFANGRAITFRGL